MIFADRLLALWEACRLERDASRRMDVLAGAEESSLEGVADARRAYEAAMHARIDALRALEEFE